MPNKLAYLTVDDGPTQDFNNKIDFLHKKGIPSIFFCTGSNIEKRKESVIDAIQKGYVIGNHTFSHFSNFVNHPERSRAEIERTEKMIENTYSKAGITRPAKLFRFPGLAKGVPGWPYYRPDIPITDKQNQLRQLGQEVLREIGFSQPKWNITYKWFHKYGAHMDLDCDCTFDSFDWGLLEPNQEYGYNTLPSILKRMDEDFPELGRGLNCTDQNEILMLHDIEGMEWAFEPLVRRLLEKGIEFILPDFT